MWADIRVGGATETVASEEAIQPPEVKQNHSGKLSHHPFEPSPPFVGSRRRRSGVIVVGEGTGVRSEPGEMGLLPPG
jgi:hypothetical protein